MRRWMTAALMLTACGRPGSPPVAAVDVVAAPDGGSMPLASSSPLPAREGRCERGLVAGSIRVPSGCFLDERISHGPGRLSLPCEGADGPAEAVFDEHRFSGSVTDGKLELDLTTQLDWEDSCRWQTRQSLRGDVTGKLSWRYIERVIEGSDCFAPCTASADVSVEP